MNNDIIPKEVFDKIKSFQLKINEEILEKEKLTLFNLFSSYSKTGQTEARNKIVSFLKKNEKEMMLLNHNIDTYVYYDDIKQYIADTKDKVIKIIEVSKYQRIIPDDIAEKISLLRKENIFDDFIIVFTDYTGEEERRIAKERREKDPIVFGIFKDGNKILSERLYYIGDWIDEYCDLTLEKLISEVPNITHDISASVSDCSQEVIKLMQELNKNPKPKGNFSSMVKKWIRKTKSIVR